MPINVMKDNNEKERKKGFVVCVCVTDTTWENFLRQQVSFFFGNDTNGSKDIYTPLFLRRDFPICLYHHIIWETYIYHFHSKHVPAIKVSLLPVRSFVLSEWLRSELGLNFLWSLLFLWNKRSYNTILFRTIVLQDYFRIISTTKQFFFNFFHLISFYNGGLKCIFKRKVVLEGVSVGDPY